MNTRCPPKRVPSAARFFTHCELTVQPPQSYGVGGQRSSGQLTGKPAGARPDYRGCCCAVSRGHPGRPNPSSPRATLGQLSAAPWELPSTIGCGIARTRTGDVQAIERILHSSECFYWMRHSGAPKSFFQQTSAAALPGQRSEAITKSLVKFICKDMRPISIVEGDGFREFCSEMESRYQIPSRTTISKNIVKLYDTTRANVKQILHECKDIALITDGWTSLATDAYVTLRGSHTAENVAECISEILDDFNIRESVIAVTTDNALNYVNAVERYLNLINIPCVAHTINLAVRKGLNTGPIERTLTRLKCSAAHFNRSPTDKCLLEDKQKLLGLKNDNLINDCVTRWNSTYDMICRASEQQAAVAAVIFEKKLSHLEFSG
ncbi:UNVERIFIED_CONTAM: hypothetical protein FKN15_017465 [Acipenser sinensis]